MCARCDAIGMGGMNEKVYIEKKGYLIKAGNGTMIAVNGRSMQNRCRQSRNVVSRSVRHRSRAPLQHRPKSQVLQVGVGRFSL
jgi:hypothetical protein